MALLHRSSAPLIVLAALFLTQDACAMGGKGPASPSYVSAPEPSAVESISVASTGAPARLDVGEMLAMGGDAGQPAPAPPPVTTKATNTATTATKEGELLDEKLVVEGWLTLDVDEVADTAAAIRKQVESTGGRVVNEQLSGGARSWNGYMQVKLPPREVPAFLEWLGQQGEIEQKRIQGTDVSRTLFDQEIALQNLTLTLSRMQKLLDREGLQMTEILAIENEMNRLRGEIERIKGEKRFLEHRVALATLDITLSRSEGVILGARAKFYPGPKLGMLVLFDAEGRESVRMGGGAVIHTVPRLTLELDIFEGPGDESRAVLATFGGATYSDFLGRGRRSFLNPYLGLRVGYGYLEGSAFVFAGGGGVELFKHKYVLLDANANVYVFAREEFDVALVAATSLVFAF